jgi:transcriptional regulator with XRE-family HTH domain
VRPSQLRAAAGKSRAEVAADLGIDEQELEQLELLSVLPDRWVEVFATYYEVDAETIGDTETTGDS